MVLALKSLIRPFPIGRTKARSKIKTGDAEQNREAVLIREMADVKMRLESCLSNYDALLDDDLIDASIYEMEALQAKYRYLLKRAKDKKLRCGLTENLRQERAAMEPVQYQPLRSV